MLSRKRKRICMGFRWERRAQWPFFCCCCYLPMYTIKIDYICAAVDSWMFRLQKVSYTYFICFFFCYISYSMPPPAVLVPLVRSFRSSSGTIAHTQFHQKSRYFFVITCTLTDFFCLFVCLSLSIYLHKVYNGQKRKKRMIVKSIIIFLEKFSFIYEKLNYTGN